ncbi:hypothetical protein FRB94_007378 [Tulasnella sp. JGI-2019a]|nr:hypothetical protein FRB94_007378 [Tulasnella sp. JGI-2019a]
MPQLATHPERPALRTSASHLGGSHPLNPTITPLQLEPSSSPIIFIPALGKPVILKKSGTIDEGLHAATRSKVAIKRLRVLGSDGVHTLQVRHIIVRTSGIRSCFTDEKARPSHGEDENLFEFYPIYSWIKHTDLFGFLNTPREHSGLPLPARGYLISDVIRAAFLDFNEANTVDGVVSGLTYLFGHGVTWGDIKRVNVLLDPLLKPIISDFGLARSEIHNVIDMSFNPEVSDWMNPNPIRRVIPRKSERSDLDASGMRFAGASKSPVLSHNLASFCLLYKANIIEDRRPFEFMSRNASEPRPSWDFIVSWFQEHPMHELTVDNISCGMLAKMNLADTLDPDGFTRFGDCLDYTTEPQCRIPPGVDDCSRPDGGKTPEACRHDIKDVPRSLLTSPTPISPLSSFGPTASVDTSSYGASRLTLSLQDSDTVCILPPGRPIHFGNCDLYKGTHSPTRAILAMKHPRIQGPGASQAKEAKRRWEKEAKIWSSLNHDNILPFYGIVEIGSEVYLVSPWIDYGDLSQFLTLRREYMDASPTGQAQVHSGLHLAFSAFEETAMIHGIALGLEYLHANCVIHGDLKAGNILLEPSLNPLIGDFGLTKNEEFDTTPPSLKGVATARWMCPSVTNNGPRSKKTDMFSFAMTIVEVLTERVPFHDKNNFQAQMAVFMGQRPPFEPLKSCNGTEFKPLWDLAESCWVHEPEDRPSIEGVVRVLAAPAQTFVR